MRPSNMDSLLLKCGTIQNRDALLALICDGVGSMADGAFASGEAVRMLNEWFDKVVATDRIGLGMRDAILKINHMIISSAIVNRMNTATTLSALLLIDKIYYIAHIGDSRIYCYDNRCAEDQALSALTRDDISESGKLTACIGQTEEIFPQYAEGAADDKIFLLCSDGLYKRMDLDVMISKIKSWSRKSLKEPVEALAQYVVDRGEQDNISVAFVKIED
jgi:serine/threonine protein phosphatase PrpC